MVINLLEETEGVLREHHFTWNAVKFISNAEGIIDIARFVSLADSCYYDNEVKENSNVNIDPTLIISGRSWWLSRILSQDREKWLFHKRPLRPTLNSPDFTPTIKRDINKIFIP